MTRRTPPIPSEISQDYTAPDETAPSIIAEDAIAAEVLDAQCKRVTSVPSRMQDYHFNQDIRAFTLGDTDTPPFKLYATSGLKPAKACASQDQSGQKPIGA